MKKRILLCLFAFVGLMVSGYSQEVISDTLQEETQSDTTIYVSSRSGKIVTLSPQAEFVAKGVMQFLVDSVLDRYLPLYDQWTSTYPPRFGMKLKSYFDETVVDKAVIPNLFQPVNTTQIAEGYVKSDYISLNDHIRYIPEWFKANGLSFDITKATDNLMVVKTKQGERIAMQLIRWECLYALPQVDSYDRGDMSVDSVFALWVKLPAFERDYHDPSQYKIMSISQNDPQASKGLINRWGFLNFSGGYLHSMENYTLEDSRFEELQSEAKPSFSVGADLEIFFGDTTSLAGQDWDFKAFRMGFGVGARFIRHSAVYQLPIFNATYINETQSPVGNLGFDSYNLDVELESVEQHYTYNVVSVPVYAIGKYSLDTRRAHNIVVRLGAAVNYTLAASYYSTGNSEYLARQCIVQGSDEFEILDLPDYGFGEFDLNDYKEELDGSAGDIAVHLFSQLGYSYSPGNRSNWDYGINICYTPQLFSTHQYPDAVVDPVLHTDRIGAFKNTILSDISHSYLGFNVQVSYNIIHNRDKKARRLR
jgi:hypothetical protein